MTKQERLDFANKKIDQRLPIIKREELIENINGRIDVEEL